MEQQENEGRTSHITGNDEAEPQERENEQEEVKPVTRDAEGANLEAAEIAAAEVAEEEQAEDVQGTEQQDANSGPVAAPVVKETTASEVLPAEPEEEDSKLPHVDSGLPDKETSAVPAGSDGAVPTEEESTVAEQTPLPEEKAVDASEGEAGVAAENDSADATKDAADATVVGDGSAKSGPQAEKAETGQEASLTDSKMWNLWQQQQQLQSSPAQFAEIPVPALMRQAQVPPDAAYEAGMERKQAAESALIAATKEAEAAVIKTASLAASSGLHYNPPTGVDVDLKDIKVVNQSQLEAHAQAVRNSLLPRQEQAAAAARAQAQQNAQMAAARESQPTTSTAMAERANATRRAAASKAAQSFKQVAQAEDDRDFLPSPPDSPVRKATKNKRPASAKKSDSYQNLQGKNSPKEGVEAWETTPPKQLVLKPTDITRQLQNKWLQVYWPDDGRWWPGQVSALDLRRQVMTLLYETGEQETDLDLSDMIKKGEVAWLYPEDAPKKTGPPVGAGRGRGGGPKAGVRRQDSFGDDAFASSSGASHRQAEDNKGRRRPPVRYMEDDEDEEDPEFEAEANIVTKGRYARSNKARSRPEPEEEIESDSDTPPPSDQSSDWHSSDDDDRPRKKKKKTTKKKTGLQGGVQRQQYLAQPMHQQHMGGAYGGHPQQRSNFYGQDSFAAFGGQRGGQPSNVRMSASHGMPGAGGFPMDHGWGVVTGQREQALLGNLAGGWNPQQDMNALLQAQARQQQQQQQQAFSGGGSRFAALDLLQARGQPNPLLQVGPGGWQNRGMPNPSAGLPDWARADMSRAPNAASMYRPQLPQMTMEALGNPARSAAGSPGMPPRPESNPQPQGQSPADRQASMANGMGALLALGPAAAGRQVTVFQARTNAWTKATVLACTSRGAQGGSALVEYDDGQQDQLPAQQEGVTYRLRVMPENAS